MRTVADRVSGCESGSIKKVSRRDLLPTLSVAPDLAAAPRLGSQPSAESRSLTGKFQLRSPTKRDTT
jgi:hypothetical protein